MDKLVSIIIPTFNRADLISDTLESIRIQTYPNFECLIVDDGSTDDSKKVISSFCNSDKRFQLFSRPQDRIKGPNTCRNYGFENAKGDFIYFFDSDDFLKPNALETYINAFQENTDGVLAHVERVDKKTGELIDVNVIQSDNLIEDYFTYEVCYFVCGILWRKSFLDQQTELFDEALGNHDEWDYNLRMIYANPNMVRLDQILVTYFQYDDSFKREIQKGNDIEINSAFQARFKHLDLLAKIDSQNRIKYTLHIANFYKKIVRNKLFANQENWFSYYQKASSLYLKSNAYLSFLKLSVAIVLSKLTKKGYSLFD
jgi:glycosyltransferase involved in cell wall biosynthesis